MADNIRMSMTLKDELYALFKEGKTPTECISLGYKRATVYRFLNDYNIDKEKEHVKILVDESELTKKTFQGFKENKNLIDMVTEYGVSPDRLRQLFEEHTKLGKLETEYQEKIKGFNEVLRKTGETEAYLKQLELKWNAIVTKTKEIDSAVKRANLDTTTFLKWREGFLDDQLFIYGTTSFMSNEEKTKIEKELKLIRKTLYEKVQPCTAHKLPTCVTQYTRCSSQTGKD